MDESWGDPDDFRPERFINEEGSIVIPDRFIPFSYGWCIQFFSWCTYDTINCVHLIQP